MEYTEKDLVKIAKRENNTKRNYLVVDPLQGKHIPVEMCIRDRLQAATGTPVTAQRYHNVPPKVSPREPGNEQKW